jgi:plasmid segregation protein ParM
MGCAIDAGNFNTKFYDGKDLIKFPSVISLDYRERNLQEKLREFDFEWEYNGMKGYAGTLAMDESKFGESRKGNSKAHFDAKLRVLLALHQYSTSIENNIVVGQPIITHNEDQKTAIKNMLIGRHELTVNGKRKIVVVRRCEVAAEGVTAGLLVQGNAKVRIIDIGSGTVNFGTLLNKRFNDLGSFTLTEGMETVSGQYAAFARQIAFKAFSKGWDQDEIIYLCGGGAEVLLTYLKEYFVNVQILQTDTEFSNVKAFYMIASKLYG